MRIFYTITKSEMGGAQTYLWRLLERAKRNGDSVVVMADGDGWLADKTRELGFEFVPNPYFKNSFNPINLLKAVWKTRQAIKKVSPGVVHCNSSAAGLFGRLAAIGTGARIIFTAHGWGFTEGTPFVRRIIVQISEALVTPLTDKILCVSHNDARLARKYLFGIGPTSPSGFAGQGKISVIHNGVPIPPVVSNVGSSEYLRILFVGRLDRPKRPLAILQAVARLDADLKKKCRIVIAAYGTQEKMLRDFAEKNDLSDQVSIKLVPTEKMGELFQNTDVLVLPSEWEGFPIAIVEALSFGIPVLASNVGGIPEAVDESVGKLLTKGNEAEELVKVFQEIAGDKNWLVSRGNAARSRALAQFSAETMCDAVWKSYE